MLQKQRFPPLKHACPGTTLAGKGVDLRVGAWFRNGPISQREKKTAGYGASQCYVTLKNGDMAGSRKMGMNGERRSQSNPTARAI